MLTLQLDIDFRVHYPDAIASFITALPKMCTAIIATARLSRKSDVVELVHQYDEVEHGGELNDRDHLYSLLALLRLLPSANTRHKAKLSSIELEHSLVVFRPAQTSIELFLTQKTKHQQQPFLLCLGSKDECGPFFLVLDKKAVPLGACGALKAVDALFKAHFVYWVGFSPCLAMFMEFVQKIVYQIDCQKVSARVKELHSSMLVLAKKNAE